MKLKHRYATDIILGNRFRQFSVLHIITTIFKNYLLTAFKNKAIIAFILPALLQFRINIRQVKNYCFFCFFCFCHHFIIILNSVVVVAIKESNHKLILCICRHQIPRNSFLHR
jgi:hypothetical protein